MLRRRWEKGSFLDEDPHYLVVAEGDTSAGWVMYEHAYRGTGGDDVWVVGILLAPEHRRRGIGTVAQRMLAEHLFTTTTAHRLMAFTEADNIAEQRALEKCGFEREGLLREGGFRGGAWRDVCVYGLLRSDVTPA